MRWCAFAVVLCTAPAVAQEKRALPRVVLVGDSIRLGYAITSPNSIA